MSDEAMGSFDIVPAHLVVKAMRDSGYKNGAYAIAELVDNAIQAGAGNVEILALEADEYVRQRTRRRVKQIAVVDNGAGMDAETLRRALQFGNGTRLDDRSGIGRFGMGLPNSSMSQARRVDVWSWQKGVDEALHSYLDLDQIQSGELASVPPPSPGAVPTVWRRVSASMDSAESGTLVVWSELDRCDWKTARAIFKNSEYTIGRIYRRMLNDGLVNIRMAAFTRDEQTPHIDDQALANDPMYQMLGTSTPSPFDSNESMFEPYGAPSVINWEGELGDLHEIAVRFSVARQSARVGHNPGGLPHGRHANNNLGVSVIRADRELELQLEWVNGYDPTERWWGVEVEFPPALDEVFGVTNNKQSARTLAEFGKLPLRQLVEREGYESEQELYEHWEHDGDPRIVLLKVKHTIESNLGAIRKTLKAQTARSKGRTRHKDHPNSAEAIGTAATNKRKAEGYRGLSDSDEERPPAERLKDICDGLVAEGLTESEARDHAGQIITDGRKYDFYPVDSHSPEFFSVRRKGGAILIGLNTNHPAYDKLITILEGADAEEDVETLKARLSRSYEGLKLLLEAWARYEDELTDGPRRESAQEARMDWGRVARQFFREE